MSTATLEHSTPAPPTAPHPAAVTPNVAVEKAAPNKAAFWTKRLAPYRHANNRQAMTQLLVTLALLAGTWAVMLWALQTSWWLSLLLAPFGGLLVIRLFIFQHDCGHGSFLSASWANNLLGFCLGTVCLTPYHYWKRTHAIHHATSGDLDRRTYGDIDTLTVNEYRSLPAWRRTAYRLYRNPIVMFVIGPVYQFCLKHRLPWDAPLSWTREWIGVIATNAAFAGLVTLAVQAVGWKTLLLIQGPIYLCGLPVGIWMFYVQHQFEDTYWRRSDEWDYHDAGLLGSSFYDLNPVLHWLTGNIGYHHIHHLASRIPNYRLQACYREVEELHNAKCLTLKESFACVRLKLWDEAGQRMVGWNDLKSVAG